MIELHQIELINLAAPLKLTHEDFYNVLRVLKNLLVYYDQMKTIKNPLSYKHLQLLYIIILTLQN